MQRYLVKSKANNATHGTGLITKKNRQRIIEEQRAYRQYNRQHKLYYCDVCEKVFGLRANLVEHYESQMHVRNLRTIEVQALFGK